MRLLPLLLLPFAAWIGAVEDGRYELTVDAGPRSYEITVERDGARDQHLSGQFDRGAQVIVAGETPTDIELAEHQGFIGLDLRCGSWSDPHLRMGALAGHFLAGLEERPTADTRVALIGYGGPGICRLELPDRQSGKRRWWIQTIDYGTELELSVRMFSQAHAMISLGYAAFAGRDDLADHLVTIGVEGVIVAVGCAWGE